MRRRLSWGLLVCALLVPRALSAAEPSRPDETALDRYVAKSDPSYRWRLVQQVESPESTTFVLEMVSQTWRTPEEVNRAEWTHWLSIVKPKQLAGTKALLYITGGRNGGEPPAEADELTRRLAIATGSVVAELKQVPNQPLVFFNDGQERFEDDLIAYTWDKFMTTGDETWPARLPMVKSAVRALDTIQAFLASPEGGGVQLDGFVVAGGSKRGWTTWMTAAVDPRVVAIAPIVIDVLNVKVSMRHHHDAYGFWAPAVGDYVRHKIVDRENDPAYDKLLAIEDPYRYRQRFTMPKYIINAAGDEFFLPDSSQFYWSDLPGEKHLRYVANGNHSLRGTDARESLAAFYDMILHGRPRPEYTWSFVSDGSIRVETKTAPREVVVWQATNSKARDFRLDTIGKAYTSTPLADQGGGVYTAQVPAPPEGFTAFFIELTYDTGGPTPFKVTSGVRVVPDVLPHRATAE